MNAGLYHGASGMVTTQRRLETIAANLANLDTVGYKRRGAASTVFRIPGKGGRRALGTKQTIDFSQGMLTRTGHPYDLALDGEGFFAAESPRGEVYTRDGRFQIDPDGVLLTSDGYPLAWTRRPGAIDPEGLPVLIDGEGGVTQGGQELGRLRLVHFEDLQRMRQDGRGYWIAPPGLREVANTAVVHQGALEGSNAASMSEVVSMIVVQRAFEANSRVMQMINQSYQRLTRVN